MVSNLQKFKIQLKVLQSGNKFNAHKNFEKKIKNIFVNLQNIS